MGDRGEGWAISVLTDILAKIPVSASHREEYKEKVQKMTSSLLPLQHDDGCWRASLHNATSYPSPEATGTAAFTKAIAQGIHADLLDRDVYYYMPVIEKAWKCLSNTVLQQNGRVGYCQPVGSRPSDTNSSSTSDFCVGLFISAGLKVAALVSGTT